MKSCRKRIMQVPFGSSIVPHYAIFRSKVKVKVARPHRAQARYAT